MAFEQVPAFDPHATAASVAIFAKGRVLLIQRAFEPLKGLWTLPGGRREDDETVYETASREVREETGLTVGRLVPVGTLGVAGRWQLQVFATTHCAGTFTPSDEIAGHRWVDPLAPGDLPFTPELHDVLSGAVAVVG